jgi:hypothetical protein
VGQLPIGGRVEIIGRRRSFVRVRHENGLEGWAKSTELISPEVRGRLLQVGEQTRHDPPQGEVRALRTLNVHLEPHRWSPSVYQLEPDEGAQLLRHSTVTRLPDPNRDDQGSSEGSEQDDWYLVRLETGRAGWVLATGVYSGIPEEVAQYAERRRIISYFALGETYDSKLGQAQPTWLWTQSSQSNQPFDFDLLRVFVWSRQRQAYQTIQIERGLRGYLPVTVQAHVREGRHSGPGFSIVVENRQGRLVKRNYVLSRDHVYRISEEDAPPLRAPIHFESPKAPTPQPPSLVERLLSRFSAGPNNQTSAELATPDP